MKPCSAKTERARRNERVKKKSVLRHKKVVFECLEGEEGMYVKSKGVKTETFGFWLRFIGEHFVPCEECQERLAKLILDSEQMILGNEKYEPPVELWRKFAFDDEAWEEVERRPSTDEEKEKFKKQGNWFA